MRLYPGYIRYLKIASSSNHYPIFPCDVFDIPRKEVDQSNALYKSTLTGQLEFSLHRWVQSSNISISGAGSASILICFGAQVHNLKIHVEHGDFFLLVGPHSSLSHLTLQASGLNNSVYIGTHVSSSHCSMLSQGDNNYILIGHDCMLSTGIHIRNSDSHSIYNYSGDDRTNSNKPVIIGDHCWIGRNVTIGKGVVIGDDNIIGQSSLVATSLAHQQSIFAGNPARRIRDNVTWDRSCSESIKHISETMDHRPRQIMCNTFLQEQKPTLPVPHAHELDILHRAHAVSKVYPWIDYLFHNSQKRSFSLSSPENQQTQ